MMKFYYKLFAFFSLFCLSTAVKYAAEPTPGPDLCLTVQEVDKGNTIAVENISQNSTVLELKKCITDKIGIWVVSQRLIFAGKELENNNKTLGEYAIRERYSTVHVVKKRTLELSSGLGAGMDFSYKLPKDNNIDGILDGIKNAVTKATGVAPSYQKIFFEETEIKNVQELTDSLKYMETVDNLPFWIKKSQPDNPDTQPDNPDTQPDNPDTQPGSDTNSWPWGKIFIGGVVVIVGVGLFILHEQKKSSKA